MNNIAKVFAKKNCLLKISKIKYGLFTNQTM